MTTSVLISKVLCYIIMYYVWSPQTIINGFVKKTQKRSNYSIGLDWVLLWHTCQWSDLLQCLVWHSKQGLQQSKWTMPWSFVLSLSLITAQAHNEPKLSDINLATSYSEVGKLYKGKITWNILFACISILHIF